MFSKDLDDVKQQVNDKLAENLEHTVKMIEAKGDLANTTRLSEQLDLGKHYK